jgi:hypothetical protein
MHFLSIHAHLRRRIDSQSNPVSLDSEHDHLNIVVNHNFFTDPPGDH